MLWIAIMFALAAGAANPFQAGTNAELNKQLGQPMLAGVWVYLSGLTGVLVLALLARQFSLPNLARAGAAVAHVPWWAWCGGVISIGSTIAGLVFAQRLGSGVFTGLSITASLLISMLLDQFGWIGFKQHTASPARLAGCALLIAGVWLVARF
jgi:transporter family-2 protein